MSSSPRIPVPPEARFGTPSFDWTAAFPSWVGPKWKRVLRTAGIPTQQRSSLKLDPVVQELCRLLNAKTQGCVF